MEDGAFQEHEGNSGHSCFFSLCRIDYVTGIGNVIESADALRVAPASESIAFFYYPY